MPIFLYDMNLASCFLDSKDFDKNLKRMKYARFYFGAVSVMSYNN